MTKKLLTVRNVDDEIFTRFKSVAVKEKMKMGDALVDAMNLWLKEKEHGRKQSFKSLLKFKKTN